MPRDTTDDARRADETGSDETGRHDAPRPPDGPEDQHPLWLGAKIATAMFLAHAICTLIGFETPTWGVIVAAYLATQAPWSGIESAKQRALATAVGLALGVAGAWGNQFVPEGFALVTFVAVGLVAGWMASRDATYLFAAVVATVITLTAQTGNETVLVEALRAAMMIAIGCAVGPAVVWAFETARGRA